LARASGDDSAASSRSTRWASDPLSCFSRISARNGLAVSDSVLLV
jgi:hypothetical protein